MIHKFRSKIEQYVPISEEDWNIIKTNCEIAHVKNKEVLVKYAALSKNAYFLAVGSFEMSLISEHGEAKTVWFFLDEIFNMFGTADSLFLDEPTKYEITALEESIVIKFDFDTVESWAKKYPNISEFMRRDLMNDFVVSHEIRNHMTSHSPIEFINYLNQKFPAILHRVPDKNIARFMGITPEWYSKLQKKMKDLN